MTPPGEDLRRAGHPGTAGAAKVPPTTTTDSTALWRALSDCPDAARRWAALGYRVGVIDGHQAVLIKIGEAGEAVTTGFGATVARLTVDELADRRRGDDRPCPARCARCSRCIRAEAAERNLRIYGSVNFPGISAARRTA